MSKELKLSSSDQRRFLYCNEDWAEHCTALTESAAGEMSLIALSEKTKSSWQMTKRRRLDVARCR